MKALVEHLVREHLPRIASQSLKHCHVRGLHSIMFVDSPEQRIRLFIATAEHELWRNTCRTLGSLAAHAHHCNITLHCIKGGFVNLEYAPYQAGPEVGSPYNAYRYVSAILNKQGGFEASEAPGVAFYDARMLQAGDSIALPANLIHSIQATKGRVSAWFVYEGREDEGYESLSYSDQYLCKTSFDGLYEPMSEAEVVALLQEVDLLDKPRVNYLKSAA